MLDQMSWEQFNRWAEYFDLEPPEERGDYRAGQICATVANTHSTKHRFRPEEFFPGLKKKRVFQPCTAQKWEKIMEGAERFARYMAVQESKESRRDPWA